MPLIKNLCDILHIGKTTPARFNFYKARKQIDDMGVEGYSTEGLIGRFACPGCCSNNVDVYWSVLPGTSKVVEIIRFEQGLQGSSGRVVMQVPFLFDYEFCTREKSGLDKAVAHKELGMPCACEIVQEKFFASCKCAGCGEVLNFWSQVRWCDELDVPRFKWSMRKKEDKDVQAKLLGEDDDDDEGEKLDVNEKK